MARQQVEAAEEAPLLKSDSTDLEAANDTESHTPDTSKTDRGGQGTQQRTRRNALLAALLYGSTSITITFFNKAVFFVWHFDYPITISLLQVTLSLFLFMILGLNGTIQLPSLSWRVLSVAAPLSIFWCLNVLSGIFTLEYMSIPMFSTLRRMTTLIVLIGEHTLLRKYASRPVWMSVIVMTIGALIAGWGDLDFNPVGYACVAINNLCTAAYLLLIKVTKTRLNVSNLQLLYLMNLCSFPCLIVAVYWFDYQTVLNYPSLYDGAFIAVLIASCVQAFVLNYATFLCTTLNSGVTTSITGQMSKLVTMTGGLFLFVNTTYTYTNLTGLFIGLISSFWYAYIKYHESNA